MKYITDNEISVDRQHSDKAMELIRILMDEGYVCMVSYEESLIIINYEWSPRDCDRNDMVFMTREDFEEILFNEGREDDD